MKITIKECPNFEADESSRVQMDQIRNPFLDWVGFSGIIPISGESFIYRELV